MTDSLPTLVFPWTAGDDPAPLLEREWLVTNGLGGYASGSLFGAATRRYHGLFVPNLPAPRGRTVLIPRLDERVHCGVQTVWLGGAEFADGRIEGDGHRVLQEFRRVGLIPHWRFELEGRVIEKRVLMPHEHNTVYVAYRLLTGDPVRLDLRPFVAFRMHDGSLGYPPEWTCAVTLARGRYEIHTVEGAPPLRLAVRPGGSPHGDVPAEQRANRRASQGVFVADEEASRQVLYRMERDRGYDHVEDVISPGYFSVELTAGGSVALVASTEDWDWLDRDGEQSWEAERHRMEKLLQTAGEPPAGPAAHLVLSADQFIILPGSRPEEEKMAHAAGDDVRTVVAGYHWFTDWGRDTMISLEGLTLCTGRHGEAKAILRTFAHYIRNGLLPNLFPEGQRTALYHTADATLWYFHALDRYLTATRDAETLQALYPVLASILDYHVKGTDFGIGMDPADGLLKAGAEGYQLTWMDAKVDDWVVTPRRGKPVEIQALWYNAIRLMAAWSDELNERPGAWPEMAAHANASFNDRFWFEAGGHLYDVIDGEQGDDASLRPNQILAMSLRFPILEPSRWRPVLEVVAERLLTPVGLRSLAPGHRDYKAVYFGDLRDRDAAYHQGTVWAWLIGPFLDAWRMVHQDTAKAQAMLAGFDAHLMEAGIGTISEIFDAESPYTPRGCVAQAWSVAEVLRALRRLEEKERP